MGDSHGSPTKPRHSGEPAKGSHRSVLLWVLAGLPEAQQPLTPMVFPLALAWLQVFSMASFCVAVADE